QQRCALDREQHDQDGCNDRRQLLVAGAATGASPNRPGHDARESDEVEREVRDVIRGTVADSMEPRDDSRLALDPALMRQLGYRTVDMLVDRIVGPPGPVVRSATPEELHNRLAIAPPEDPVAFDEILEGLERDVLPY